MSPVIEESQEPDDEHAAQEEPDASAQANSNPSNEGGEHPCGMAQESEKRKLSLSRESYQVHLEAKA